MTKAYHIVNWDQVNETAESRKYRNLAWYGKSNKLVGMGIGRLRAHPNAVALYCAWCLMEILASSSTHGWRGWLVRGGRGLTPEDMAFLTGFNKGIFEAAVGFFVQPEIGWLEERELAAESPGSSPDGRVTGTAPAESPGSSPDGRVTGRKSATDRQTDRQSTDRHSLGGKNKGGEATTGQGGAKTAPGGSVAASRTQWAALKEQVKELEGLGSGITPTQKQDLRKKRATLQEIEKRQAAGNFEVVQTAGQGA